MLYEVLLWLFSDGGARHYAYESTLFRGLLSCLTAFLIVWFMGPRVIRMLIKAKMGDVPDFDRQDYNELTKHKANVPTMGGVLIITAMIGGIVCWANLGSFYIHLAMLCIIWLGVLGFIDDRNKLISARYGEGRDGLKLYQKLLFQFGLALLLTQFIYREGGRTPDSYFNVLSLPFVKFDPETAIHLPYWLFALIGLFVLSGTSNAVNLTDGMDGLAAGCVVVAAGAFMAMTEIIGKTDWASYMLLPPVPGADELSIVMGAVIGACLGFLWYNCHPAQVFMGDTGSLPLGGVLAYVAIVLRQELILLIVGGVFVMEAMSVIIQVTSFKRRGKRVFKMAPIHHHFHLLGWKESQVVARFWLLSVLFAILALVAVKLRFDLLAFAPLNFR